MSNLFAALSASGSALGAFERALEASPRHFKSVIGLAYALGAVDPNADVGPLYREAIEIAPEFLEGRTLLARNLKTKAGGDIVNQHLAAVHGLDAASGQADQFVDVEEAEDLCERGLADGEVF